MVGFMIKKHYQIVFGEYAIIFIKIYIKFYLQQTFIKRFLNFTDQIKKSKKIALKNVFHLIKKDTQSVTGKNLREILLLTDKNDISELGPLDSQNIKYKVVPPGEEWRIDFLKELINVRTGDLQVNGFTEAEINSIIGDICSS